MHMSEDELLAYGKKYMESVGGFIKNNHYTLVDIKKIIVLWKLWFKKKA